MTFWLLWNKTAFVTRLIWNYRFDSSLRTRLSESAPMSTQLEATNSADLDERIGNADKKSQHHQTFLNQQHLRENSWACWDQVILILSTKSWSKTAMNLSSHRQSFTEYSLRAKFGTVRFHISLSRTSMSLIHLQIKRQVHLNVLSLFANQCL